MQSVLAGGVTSQPTTAVQARRQAQAVTAGLCVLFVAAAMTVQSIRLDYLDEQYRGWLGGFLSKQVDVLGLLAAAMAIGAVICGVLAMPSVARRFQLARPQVVAVQLTLAGAALLTVALHIVAAETSGQSSWLKLLVPFAWGDGFPEPMGLGILAFWLAVGVFAARVLRRRPVTPRTGRLLGAIMVLASLAVILHILLLTGWVGGSWAS